MISREHAKEVLENLINHEDVRRVLLRTDVDAIKCAISVLSENKGEWISHYDEDAKEGWYECSCCHSERAFNTNFCPDCGADMREPKGEKGTE